MITEGVIYGMSDEDYHKQLSREEHFYSSSQLKTMLEDPQKFYEQYILGKKEPTPPAMQDAFDVGTVAHTAVLEPDKLKGSYVKFDGTRKGKAWEEFQEKNEGKLILTKKMVEQANNAIKAIRKSAIAMNAFNDPNGQAEVSFFLEDFHGIRVKIRTDWLLSPSIDDLKTTTGNVRDVVKIKNKIKQLNYDLSAALYVDVVNHCIDQFDLDIPYIQTFRWIFASKDKGGACQTYDAKAYLPMGRAKYLKAIELIKYHEANNWSFPEEVIALEPFAYEVGDWIKQPESDDSELL